MFIVQLVIFGFELMFTVAYAMIAAIVCVFRAVFQALGIVGGTVISIKPGAIGRCIAARNPIRVYRRKKNPPAWMSNS